MTVTLELPSEVEAILREKAQVQGLTVPDLLLELARTEARQPTYSYDEINGFLEQDRISPEVSDKVRGLLNR